MDTLNPPPASVGKYQLRRVLGRGAMGIVYDGWDPVLSRRVAIKTVRLLDNDDPEAQEGLARFRNEAQAAARLSHPNIVAVYDYGEVDEFAFIVMEFVDGQSLKQRLDAHEPFSVAETVRLMEQVLAALQFSHDKGVIHRDIKPGNVMMTAGGEVKLTDFGIARIESTVMTAAGTILGTPAYMSPEQLMAEAVDARSDIYASGVLLYQLLTGERPFEGGLTAIIHKALNTVPPRPSELSVTAPPRLDAVVATAMARRPDDRYPSAAAFARALRKAYDAAGPGLPGIGAGLDDDDQTAVIRSSPATQQPGAVPQAAPARQRARRPMAALLGGAVVLVLAVIGGGTWLTLQPSSPQPGVEQTDRGQPAEPPRLPAMAATPVPDTTEPRAQLPASSAQLPAPPAQLPAAPLPAADPSLAANPPRSGTETPPAPQPNHPSDPQPAATPASEHDRTENTLELLRRQLEETRTNPVADQVAVVSPNPMAIRDALTRLARSASCALPRFSVSDEGHLSASGLVGAGAPDSALRDAVQTAAPGAPLSWDIRAVDGPYCGVLDIIRPIAQPSSPFLSLTLKDDATRLKEHDAILPILKLPEFPSHLQVDYFSHDGSVAHLFPVPGVPNRPFAANAMVPLANFLKGKIEVGPPFGTDIIMAIASSVPLFPGTRNDETVATYVRALQAAIEASHRSDAKLTARAIMLQTEPQ